MDSQRQREMFAEIAALAGSLGPAPNGPGTSKHDLVSPRGIHDMMMFDFDGGASSAIHNPSLSVSASTATVASPSHSCVQAQGTSLLSSEHGLSSCQSVLPHHAPCSFSSGNACHALPSPTSLAPLPPSHLAPPGHQTGSAQGSAASTYPVKAEISFATESVSHPAHMHTTPESHLLGPCESQSVAYPPRSVVVPPSSYERDQITPWLDEQTSFAESKTSRDEDLREWSGSHCVDTGDNSVSQSQSTGRAGGAGSHGVMPPTAKSILERRERAIREGRRHEAKLTDEERRILRRLRNRESAERCAKRKHEQADLLARKITSLERENRDLRSLASQYESEIAKLEKFLMSRPLSQPTGAWSGDQ